MTSFAHKHAAFHRFTTCLMLVAFTSVCMTIQPVPTTGMITVSNQVEVGDKVIITKRNGGIVKLGVTQVSTTGIGATAY